MYTMIGNTKFEVKETNGKYFYWSKRALRWMPVKKANVVNDAEEVLNDFNYVGSRHHY